MTLWPPAGAGPARARRQEARRQEARMQGAGLAPGGEGGQGLLTRATGGVLLYPVNFSHDSCEREKIRSKFRTAQRQSRAPTAYLSIYLD